MAKMGRPKIAIDLDQLESMMKLSPSIQETADFFRCSHDVIERFVKEKFQETFASFRDKRAVHTRMSIKRKMIEKALSGDNTMLIWLSKNMLGMSDKVENLNLNHNTYADKSTDELRARLKELEKGDK